MNMPKTPRPSRRVSVASRGPAEHELLVLAEDERAAPAAEAFRRLAIRLRHGHEEGTTSAWVITSPAPAEGKTLVAANLAFALAEDPVASILLLDADLRRPTLQRFFTNVPPRGLVDVLSGKASFDEAVCREDRTGLHVLFAGRVRSRSEAAITTWGSHLAALFDRLRGRYDVIVVDTPPAGVVADASSLAPICGNVLLVARSFQTPRLQLLATLEQVGPEYVRGIVMNAVEPNFLDHSAHRYDYYRRYTAELEDVGPGTKGD